MDLVFESTGVYLLACAVLLVAQIVYVLFGFGAGLIAVGSLALVLPDVQDVVVILLLVCMPAELFVVGTSHRELRWREILWICSGIAVGVPIGAIVLREAAGTTALLLLGGFLVVAALGLFALPDGRRVRWPRAAAPPVGLASGVLGGMFGTGGPPLILYYQLAGTEKSVFRANLMAIFLVVTAVRLPTYLLMGLITLDRALSALAVMPAVLVGGWLGHRLHITVHEPLFRRLVCVALFLIGILLVLRT